MAGEPSALTVGRLADEPGLGLGVSTAGDLGLPVTGAHAIEIEHPARWLVPGSVMLTTGLRLAELPDDDLAAQCHQLVDQLVDVEVSALLFGVGIHFSEVPAPLTTAAAHRGLTVLSVAAETPFHRIEDFVNRSVVSSRTRVLERSLRLHDDLLRSLGAPDPVAALINRVAILGAGSAALYDRAGSVVTATGDAPLRLIWEEIDGGADPQQLVAVGRWTVATRSFSIAGSAMHLAVAARSAGPIEEIGSELLETAVHIIGAANGIRSVTLTHVRAEAGRLITTLQAGLPPSQIRQTWDRLRQFHLRPGDTMRYLVANPLPGETVLGARRPTDELLELAQSRGLGLLLHEADDHRVEDGPPVVAIVTDNGDETAGEWIEMLGQTHLIGLSTRFGDLTVVPEHVSEAHAAWRLVGNRYANGGRARVLAMDDVDLATWIMSIRDDRRVREMADRQLGELADRSDLRETVVAYLASDQDLKATARRLFIHVNTVRYRLGKVESLIGAPLASPSTVTNLYLALQDEVIGARDA